jgi:hypothetical protein
VGKMMLMTMRAMMKVRVMLTKILMMMMTMMIRGIRLTILPGRPKHCRARHRFKKSQAMFAIIHFFSSSKSKILQAVPVNCFTMCLSHEKRLKNTESKDK